MAPYSGNISSFSHRGQAGQAAVESALTLPLTVFLILGTLQLFGMLQARIMAQYAVARAGRAGSLNYGSCDAMRQAAVAALIPSFEPFLKAGNGPAWVQYKDALERHLNNHYDASYDHGHTGPIAWLFRGNPNDPNDIFGRIQQGVPGRDGVWGTEDLFDLPADPAGAAGPTSPMLMHVRMVFWYPTYIPFANWVMSKMALAQWGVAAYASSTIDDPLMPVQHANWQAGSRTWYSGSPTIDSDVLDGLQTLDGQRQYSFPIQVTFVTRMMTPPRNDNYQPNDCRAQSDRSL